MDKCSPPLCFYNRSCSCCRNVLLNSHSKGSLFQLVFCFVGNVCRDKETWWWDEEVLESIRKKRLAKKRWDIQRDEESKQ